MSEHCDEALAKLYHYLDGELDANAVAQIKAHLEDCPPCDGAFSFERRLRVVVRTHLHEEVPQVVIDRIRTVLHQEQIID